MDHRKDISEIATGTKRWAVMYHENLKILPNPKVAAEN